MSYTFIDTHTHPQMRQYDQDRSEVMRRAQEAGVAMICVGVDLESSHQAIALANEHDGVWASVGLHPNDNLQEIYDQQAYAQLAEDGSVVAIGEIGLDYYRTPDKEQQIIQRQRFEQQLQLAELTGKPCIIHCREAHTDMRAMLHGRVVWGVIHSFTGTWPDAQRYLELGFCLGFNGIITFARQYDEIVRQIPLERLFLETDAPFLTPLPYRGKRNESSYLPHIAQKIAELRGITVQEVAQQTTKNAKALFGLV